MKSHFNQKFDIDVYFTIKYFADKHGKTIQDEQNGQRIVFMEFIKNMAIHTLNTLTLMRMELDAHQKRGRY